MLNNINLMGRLVRDPEMRHTQTNTPVATYTLAVNRDFTSNGSKETDFFDVVVWQKAAEFATKHFRKGQLVVVQGRLQSRKWVDKDGNNRAAIEIVAERQYFAEGKKQSEPAAPPDTTATVAAAEHPGAYPGFTIVDDEEELPF